MMEEEQKVYFTMILNEMVNSLPQLEEDVHLNGTTLVYYFHLLFIIIY